MSPETLAIIPAYIQKHDDLVVTAKAVATLRATAPDVLIGVVDDCSPAQELLPKLEEVVLRASGWLYQQPENRGFSAAVNVGLRTALEQEKNALLVNADIEFFNKDWLGHMLANPADVVGAKLLYSNGLVQHAGVFYSIINRQLDHIYRLAPSDLPVTDEPRICPVTGALQLIKLHTMKKVGLYDEKFELGYEDVDYCYRVFQAGMKCAYEPNAVAVHHEGMFRYSEGNNEKFNRGLDYLQQKHAGHSFVDYMPTLLWDD